MKSISIFINLKEVSKISHAKKREKNAFERAIWPVFVVAGDGGMFEDDSVGFDDVSAVGFDAIAVVAGCVSVALVDSMSAL